MLIADKTLFFGCRNQFSVDQYGGGGVSGRSILDPSPAVVAPLLWASANPITRARTAGSLDLPEPSVDLPPPASGALVALRKAIPRGPSGINEWLRVEWR